MKIHEVRLQRFRQFKNCALSFLDARGLPRDLVVLVGKEGSGKSTVLQAIAATLGTATGRLSSPGDLEWPGLDFKQAGRGWSWPPQVQMEISFKDAPTSRVVFTLEGNQVTPWCANAPHELVYWYTEERAPPTQLTEVQARHTQVEAERGTCADLDQKWRAVFPGRSLKAANAGAKVASEQVPFFFLDPNGRSYELNELSGAERAIFPILFDFANWNIHDSIILIDELELHLHPPLQQALLRALPHLGTNNQFIVTTHSDHVADLVDPDAILRMDCD